MKVIEVVTRDENLERIRDVAMENGAEDAWLGGGHDDGARRSLRVLVGPEARQAVMDALQSAVAFSGDARILVLPVEVSLPRREEEEEKAAAESEKERVAFFGVTREELYAQIDKGSRLDLNYLLLVVLSTVVAAIGLVEDNVAVIIGAMVIAPLLGPNIALAFATTLGDSRLTLRSLATNFAGLTLAVVLSMAIAWLWPAESFSREIMARTDIGLDDVALALASGAAGVLSLTAGVSSVLVGVMVAVALLPPAASLGIMLGNGQWILATGAGLLLAVNVVAVNLSAKLVFLLKGIQPRTWFEKQKARHSSRVYMLIWGISLAILVGIILLRGQLGEF